MDNTKHRGQRILPAPVAPPSPWCCFSLSREGNTLGMRHVNSATITAMVHIVLRFVGYFLSTKNLNNGEKYS